MRHLAHLAILLATAATAQPGWRPLQFSFILEVDGQELPREELARGGLFSLEVEGRKVQPGSYGPERFSFVEFPGAISDISTHVDTLWLRIIHHQEGVMEVGFPPRRGDRHAYPTRQLVVPFAPGRVLVTDLLHEVHVTGTMTGIGQLWNAGPAFLPHATCGADTVRHVPATVGGAMDFRVRCRTRPGPRGEQLANLRFFTDGPYQPELVMNILAPASGGDHPLGTVRFAPADYRALGWWERELDTSTQRDTVYGWDRYGNVVYQSPAHPTANDTLFFRFWWLGGGEQVRITHRIVPGFEGEQALVFEVQCLEAGTPEAGYHAREVTVAVPPLPGGKYQVAIVQEEDPSLPAPRFPALHGQWLSVR
ncbi:MAG TPA: hypothetical protein P5027_13210 [Flavobacteriales bacterium]|nr:hypothetical protein [Flavobacteriales bacterium]HRW90902.1 hypothetical protein [Flavobacteriales bacterium]